MRLAPVVDFSFYILEQIETDITLQLCVGSCIDFKPHCLGL